MDALLLEAVLAEVTARLVEQEVARVACIGDSRYLFRLDSPRHDQLLLSLCPDSPRLHLQKAPVRKGEERPERFAALLDQELSGATLLGLRRQPGDRIAFLRFRPPRPEQGPAERRLVVELLGRSANALLLDAEDRILGIAREVRGAGRRLETGERYQPPPARGAEAGLTLAPGSLAAIRERFAHPAEFLAGLSPALARDAGSDDPYGWSRVEELLRAATTGAWSPAVYSRRPLADLKESEPIERGDLVVVALRLRSDGAWVEARFESPSDAAETGFGTLERSREFQTRRARHVALVRHEIERLERLAGKLEQERTRAADSDRFRRQAEALLAGLAQATVAGGVAILPDPYASPGGVIEVPVDPALTLPDNAQALFARYKKGKRALLAIASRLRVVRDKLDAWRRLLPQAERIGTAEDLDALRAGMDRLGLVHAPSPSGPGRRAPRRESAPTRVRRHTSPDGLVILIGKSGDENDALTFTVASPADFWLHAAGSPGAHVVVRNPQRLKTLPEATLRQAAAIAAFYSGAREERHVEVHYTQRKHVQKRRGMARGQVLLRRFRSIEVAPALPDSPLEDL